MLRNGEVFRGIISRSGDRFLVTVPSGRVVLRASEVDFCCSTLQEAYHRKRERKPPDSVQDHLALAQWCQRYGLLESAAEELAAAKAADPSHPMIPLVERRIAAASEATLRQASPAKPVPGGISPMQLDRMVRGMPPGTVESFTQTIQPMLMNNCASGGCHGPAATDTFSLLRIPVGTPPSRRMTQRNLHTVLQWIDQENPDASPLLTAATRPHGSAKAPIFTDRQVAQYRQLLEWVYQVSQVAPPPAPPPQMTQNQAVARPDGAAPAVFHGPVDAAQPADGPQSEVVPASAVADEPNDAVRTAAGSNPQGTSPSPMPNPAWDRPGVQRGAELPQFVPADPFDPEIFNRQFFPAAPPAPR